MRTHTNFPTKDFKYKYIVTNLVAGNNDDILNIIKRYNDIHEWLCDNVGIANFELYYEYDKLDWILYLNSEEDMVIFKLYWSGNE